MAPDTNFVLDNISTTPVLVRLEDYCRKERHPFNNTQDAVRYVEGKGYHKLRNKSVVDNKYITIFVPKDYEFTVNSK